MEPRPTATATRRRPDPIIALAGAFSVVLGASVLVGWHAGIEPLRIYPGFTPMAYNTAISFVGVGVAFVAMAFIRRSPSRLFAGVAGLIALLRLIQYATGVPKIVERHGGKIWVESKPNQGATFRFTIPMV